RAQIAMHDARIVRKSKPIADLHYYFLCFIDIQFSFVFYAGGKRLPLKIFHDDKRRSIILSELECINRNNIAMVQRCQQSSLSLKSFKISRLHELTDLEKFYCDSTPELSVLSAKHGSEATFSKRLDNLVAVLNYGAFADFHSKLSRW